jgi:hypothetical protein
MKTYTHARVHAHHVGVFVTPAPTVLPPQKMGAGKKKGIDGDFGAKQPHGSIETLPWLLALLCSLWMHPRHILIP